MSDNQLAEQTSPYLRLHKDNPVHWRPWGPEALAEAKEKNKPILLSVGYTACHWCHVMNHESFADPETGALMNDLFVNIKVDREERPDIDQLYQTASIHMGHSGGWPLTMFLTPDGNPYLAGGYMPPQPANGRNAFSFVLKEAARQYHEDPDRIAKAKETIGKSLSDLWSRDFRSAGFPASVLEYITIRIGQRFDVFYGGVIGAPKFHSSGLVEFLYRGYLRSGAPQLQLLARTSVDHMTLGGMFDHLGGGFYRYATDERWLIPHFEKMLYDNSEIVELLTLLWQNTRIKLYADRAEETIGWLLREMRAGDGFASSIDADSEGEEGRYYLWTEPEVDAALAGTFSQRFKQIYGVTRAGNFQGRNVLQRLGSIAATLSDADEALLAKQRELLLEARNKRVRPMRDDKILTDWNAMAICALARAGAAFRRADWTREAVKTFDFIMKHLGDGERLYHSLAEGKRQHMAFAEDYAQMARAAYVMFEVTGEKRFLDHAQTWVRVLNTHFWDDNNGGYFYSADDDEPLIIRARMAADQSTPSANGVMVGVLTQLYLATYDRSYLDRVNALLQAFSGELGNRYVSYGAYLNGLDSLLLAIQIVVVGPRNSAKTQELISAVRGRALPAASLLVVEPDQKLPETHPAFGKAMQGGVPTAYVCQQQTCGVPVTSAVALSQILQLPLQTAVAGRA